LPLANVCFGAVMSAQSLGAIWTLLQTAQSNQ